MICIVWVRALLHFSGLVYIFERIMERMDGESDEYPQLQTATIVHERKNVDTTLCTLLVVVM